jgi:hypothetical protein
MVLAVPSAMAQFAPYVAVYNVLTELALHADDPGAIDRAFIWRWGFQRCDDGRVQWLCVDLPDAIAVRERFLKPTDRCRHLALSAVDLSWMDGRIARRLHHRPGAFHVLRGGGSATRHQRYQRTLPRRGADVRHHPLLRLNSMF